MLEDTGVAYSETEVTAVNHFSQLLDRMDQQGAKLTLPKAELCLVTETDISLSESLKAVAGQTFPAVDAGPPPLPLGAATAVTAFDGLVPTTEDTLLTGTPENTDGEVAVPDGVLESIEGFEDTPVETDAVDVAFMLHQESEGLVFPGIPKHPEV